MEEYFNLKTEDGSEHRCKVILTFDSDDYSYVLYSLIDDMGNEAEEVSALRFELDDEGNMTDFASLETDEEWDMVSEVFNTMMGDASGEESESFTVTDENGEDFVCEALHKFELEEFGRSYVLYVIAAQDEEASELFAAQYTPGENGEIIELHPIETDEEWEKVEEQLVLLQGE